MNDKEAVNLVKKFFFSNFYLILNKFINFWVDPREFTILVHGAAIK